MSQSSYTVYYTHTHTPRSTQAGVRIQRPLLRLAGPISSGIHSKNTHTPAGCMPRGRLQAAKLRGGERRERESGESGMGVWWSEKSRGEKGRE